MANRIILHIDMNSYFASVEQQANPFLRGKAVGVCAYLSPGGCIIASSMEAKAKGIKTGCTVRDALALDPKVVLLENEPAKYRSTTEKLYAILGSYTDTMEPYSIDEAFLDLTGWVKDFAAAERVGREIQGRITAEIGEWLGSSVGISWTKFLAKFASDIAPKKGLLMIDSRGKLSDLFAGRALVDAWGINTRMEARLNVLGIKDLLDLKNFSPDRIRRALGRYGYYLWAGVNGEEITKIQAGAPAPKSVGHSYCLPKQTTDKEYLAPILYKLCEKTGRRLRTLEREARVLNVGWAYTRDGGIYPVKKTFDGSGQSADHRGQQSNTAGSAASFYGANKSRVQPHAMFTTEEIYSPAYAFLASSILLLPVRMLYVSVSRFSAASSQQSLFEDNLSRKDLSRALDKLNDKYGEYTVIRGSMWGTKDAARDRIGFRKTVA